MPTRTGALAVLAGVLTVAMGRFFGVLELYVVGAAAITLPVVSLVRVHLSRVAVTVRRRLHPSRVHAGAPAQVTLELTGHRSTGELVLTEPVEHTGGATIGMAPMHRDEVIKASYRLPTSRRGVLRVGPLLATVVDPFGLAARSTVVAPAADLLVYPRLDPVLPPRVGGAGPLGAHLARRALATAAGAEFHSQREYLAGDDLRRVNWRASARADELIVRETTHDGRLLVHVVLDLVADADPGGDTEAFERAVSAAASIAVSVTDHDLPLRFELTDGTWFRGGAELVPAILEHLALVEPAPAETPAGGRSDHDLLGVAVLISADPARRSSALRSRVSTATAATVVVATGTGGSPTAGAGWFHVDAGAPERFVEHWNQLVGDQRRSPLALGAGATG